MENEIIFEAFDFFDLDFGGDGFETRYIKPPKQKEIPIRKLKYRNAEKMAQDIAVEPNMWAISLIDGTFIAGDFIEAFIKKNNLHVTKLSISTLSLSGENVDSLCNLLSDGWVQRLDLIVSDGFFANYRHDTIPYIYQELDIENRFQLAVSRVHTKIILIETSCGLKLSIRGSANLRSSGSIEHLEVQENREIFDFFMSFHDNIVDKYKTINKDAKSPLKHIRSLKKNEAWQAVI